MQVGDGESQPTEGVVTLDDLADAMVAEDETAPDESEEGEESEESEGSEAKEEEAEETEEEEEQEEPTFTIKHDGKEVTLKQSELVEMAQKGFDYSQKTMAVAEERKTAESVKAQAEQYRQQSETLLQDQLNRLQAIAEYAKAQVGKPPPIELAQQDAYQYLAQKELYESRQGQLQQALQAIQQTQDQAQLQRQAWIQQQADETEKALRDTLPGWNDETLTEYAKYADGLGLNPGTVELAFVQKGFWELIHKAKAFDALQAKKAELKPTAKLAKVAKPVAQNQPAKAAERVKREQAFNKNPSVDSLAEFLR
jgi:hypothetical protein